MKQPRIYVDTSVVGGCLDEEFQEPSRPLFDLAKGGAITLVVSDLMLAELERAPVNVQRVLEQLPDEWVDYIASTPETESLRDDYLAEEIVSLRSSSDAHHVAIATVCGADMIVSWNFRHIVHYDKIRRFNAINLREGYGTIEIYSPLEVV